MYVTISAQKLGDQYSQSVTRFAEYLDKENEGKDLLDREPFFDHNNDQVSRFHVIKDIDANTRKLKQKEPKFYSITLNPSRDELNLISRSREDLRKYTRSVMEQYATCFKNEIHGKPVSINDIVYYAKIERGRTYNYWDKEVKENARALSKMKDLNKDLADTKDPVKIKNIEKEIENTYRFAPHKHNGILADTGVAKPGYQDHVHVIVSRKDRSNSFSLSPGSKYKSSEALLNGKEVKRGFDRDGFFDKAEKTFDRVFEIDRNYMASYRGKNDLLKNTSYFISKVAKLPSNEKALAYKFINKATGLGEQIGMVSKVIQLKKIVQAGVNPQLAVKEGIKLLAKVVTKGIEAGSIQI